MKRFFCFLGLWAALTGGASAAERPYLGVGVDVNLPFTLLVNGNGQSGRGNFNLGLDVRHWFSESVNWGLRFGWDVEKRAGSFRQIGIAPGVARHWLLLEPWRPFLRLDVPVVFQGALNGTGRDDRFDLGVSGGAGFVWKLGEALGVNGLEFRYDFGFRYFFGVGDAAAVFGLDLFRCGLDWRF